MAQQEKPQFVTVAEVADLMRVSKMTVYRMIHAGELPAMRVGKSFRVPQSAVTALIEAGLSGWDVDETGTTGR
ncbi:MAG: helix-turn-helix domain-containing protein [Actinomycetaceae bacterium]|nr:helix-turn-helix domain-containing protein [Actinomycetaceae bacterium]